MLWPDYEHNRNQEHASGMYCKIMPFLFLCAWCGLTHMGIAIRAIPHDNAYHNKPRVMQRVFETSYFTPIEKSNQTKMHARITLQTNLLGHPVREAGCTLWYQHYQKQWKGDYYSFDQQTCLDDCAQLAFCQSKNTRHNTTDEQNSMHEIDENDENDNACGITYKNNQGCDDQTSRSQPLSHWCRDCDFREVCDQQLRFKALLEIETSAIVSDLPSRHFPLQRGRARESKNNTWTWTLIAVIMAFSEICHTIIAQECRRLRKVRDDRRITSSCNPVRAGVWVFVFRTCLCLGLLWFVSVWGFWCGPSSHPLTLIKKPCKHRHTKFMKQHTPKVEKFNVEVNVFFHGTQKPLHLNHVLGDGNCYWRAVAKQTQYSWYRLKKLTTSYMMQYARDHRDEKLLCEIKKLQKKNAWANMLAVLGTVSFLNREVRVCVRQHILRCSPGQHDSPASKGVGGTINLFFDNNHYSGVDAGDVKTRLDSADPALVSSFREFCCIPVEQYCKDKIIYRHRMNHQNAHNIGFLGSRVVSSHRIKAQANQSGYPTMSAPRKVAYRPAGTVSGQRRPGESMQDQIARLVKAKAAVGPREPPGPPPKVSGISGPKEPPHPPPGYRRPPTPPQRPTRSPDIGDIGTTLRRPPTPPMRPSRNPNLIDDVSHPAAPMPRPPSFHRLMSHPASSLPTSASDDSSDEGLPSTTMPASSANPTPTRPTPTGEVRALPTQDPLPGLRLQKVVVCSRGTKVADRFTPAVPESKLSGTDTIVKSLHHVSEKDRDRSLQKHVGINGLLLKQCLRQPAFVKAVAEAVAQTLRSKSAVLMFECVQGRHRSVAAATVAAATLKEFVEPGAVTIRHLSSFNWKGTCEGKCEACKAGPEPDFQNSILEVVDAVRELMRDYMAHATGSACCSRLLHGGYEATILRTRNTISCLTASRVRARFQGNGCFKFGERFWGSGKCCLQPVKADLTCQGLPSKFDVIRCRLVFVSFGFGCVDRTGPPPPKTKDNRSHDDPKRELPRNDGDRNQVVSASANIDRDLHLQSLCSAKFIPIKQTPSITTQNFSSDTKNAQSICYDVQNINKNESKRRRKKHTQHAYQLEGFTSFIAHRFSCRGLLRMIALVSMLPKTVFTSYGQVLQGGMLNPAGDELRDELSQMVRDLSGSSVHSGIAPLEECANNILVGDSVCLESVKMLLDHPEAPFLPHGDGLQITLGAARLSLTKTSNIYPNFTKVITTYMQQCNSKACGTTIVINKNIQTSLHTDSRNEKLPAYLTAITDFNKGEIFLKSDYGKDSFEGHKGFLMPIPICDTIVVPTFKIPHATNHWTGNRIIMVLFTSPLKRIDACKQNLKLQLQQLGFRIPEIDKRWIDCEITGNIQGRPIYSKPTSIRGYFATGERRCNPIQVQGDFGCGCMHNEGCEISSEWEVDPNLDQTRTWTDPFDSQISDIERCEDEAPSPATTILDSDSELHLPDNNRDSTDANRGQKRKNLSIEATSNCHPQEFGDELRHLTDQGNIQVGYNGCYIGFDSEVLGNRTGMQSNSIYEIGDGTQRHEQSLSDLFGFNNSRIADWSIRSDPIELCTDDELSCPMSGGGAPDAEFQPNKTDISKLVQKLKNVKHGYAPKQIRMLLISDAKFYKKIDRTTDTKQLQNCVAAAAQRMGLSNATYVTQQAHTTNNPAVSSRQKNDVPSFVTDQNPSGKGRPNATQKGKGKGDISQNEQKGRGKGKNAKHGDDVIVQKHDTEHAASKGKAKGKGKQDKISYSIDPEGWNVRPLSEFSNTHGGVYMCEKEEQAKHIAEKGVGRNYPIGIVAPFPMDIGVKQPEPICVEFVRHFGDQNQKISMQAFLHQITYVDVEYRKMAPAVNIQKPSIAKTSVCYLTFSDHGACAQTQIEIEQKKIAAVKQWVSSLVQHNRNLEILDVWNVQALQKQVTERIYQASVRVQSAQVESLLAMSGPGKLQVNVPGALRTNLQHIWLKKEGRPMTEDEVIDIMNEHAGQHLGAFQVRGTWALRMLADRHNEMKIKLGRNEDPAYFLSNVPPEMEAENIQEILQQLKWKATVKEGERRWKRAGYTWMVRSSEDPKVWQFPITFGYERRTLKIEAARKPKITTSPPAPANNIMQFPTWNAQCRIGKLQPRTPASQPTFADVVNNAARKRHRPEIAPMQREDSENWSDIEENVPKQDDSGLKQQLQDMMKQNSEQQQTIQQLMQQIQTLTAQVQALTAQNLAGGANNSGGVMPHSNNAS